MTPSARPPHGGDPAAGGPGPRRTPGTSSSRKVLQLMLSFSERRTEATVAELAELIGAPIPTTYRYVALLKELQLLEEGPAGRYHLTSRMIPLARAAQLADDLAGIARPILAEAAQQLRETVLLFQHFGDSATCVECVEYDRPMRFTLQPGHSLPLGVGASGKMLLASLPEPERARRLAEIVSRRGPGLREQIGEAARNRYAVSSSEFDEGVWACSVPVSAADRRATVLSMAGPGARIGEDARRAAASTLRTYAERIHTAIAAHTL